MTRLLAGFVIVGAVLVATGAWLMYPPAGLLVAGGGMVVFGLLYDDGEAPDAPA